MILRPRFIPISVWTTLAQGILLFGIVASVGCRSVPFHPMSAKAAQSLALNREGIAAFEREEYDIAETKLEAAIKAAPNDPTARRYYAETLWARGKKDDAIRTLMETSRETGSLEEELAVNRSLAEKLLALGHPVAALRYSEKLVELAPKQPDGWGLRGNVYWQLGKTDEALADYHKAIHYAPHNREILRQMATLEYQAGLTDRSLATWQALGRLYPTNREPVEVLCGKGGACQQMKRFPEAADFYRLAIDQAPEQVELYAQLTDLYLLTGETALAMETATRANERLPANPQSLELARRVEQVRLATSPGVPLH